MKCKSYHCFRAVVGSLTLWTQVDTSVNELPEDNFSLISFNIASMIHNTFANGFCMQCLLVRKYYYRIIIEQYVPM